MKKIGIIDSGVGGLTILSQLLQKNLHSKFYYISDEKNVPYGNKSQDFMLKQMTSMTKKLIAKGVDGVLIACNTATAETIDKLRSEFNIPFVGIEPYLNFINKQDVENKNVGLILTEATFNSSRFQELIKKYDSNQTITVFPLKSLATTIERLKYEEFTKLKLDIDEEVHSLKKYNFDILLLGCTHYPIISKYLEKELSVQTIDPSIYVINQLINSLELEVSESNVQVFSYNADNTENWVKTNINMLNFIS